MSRLKAAKKQTKLTGIAASPGIVTGKVFLYFRNEPPITVRTLDPNDIPAEVDRFLSAIEKAKQEINVLRQEYVKNTGAVQEGMIFEAHAMILEDPMIVENTISGIEKTKMNAEYCFNLAINGIIDMFAHMKQDFFKDRVVDIIDIKRRILRNLTNHQTTGLRDLTEPVVIVATDLGPSDTATMNKKNVQAILTDVGGYTSHSVIIARAMGIPAVVALSDVSGRVQSGDFLVVDGNEGVVILNPTPKTQRSFLERQHIYMRQNHSLRNLRDELAITLDGFEVHLAANIETKEEVKDVKSNGARGIGLLRTEFLCIQRGEFPSEEEQYRLYASILEAASPDPVVIRTYDLGGDKFAILGNSSEKNPFLGWRAIRFCLDHPEIFKAQLKAILRAGCKGKLKIMLPFIYDVAEIVEAKKYIVDSKHELQAASIPYCDDYELGVMIETPSAAICADIIAPEVDFFSIGSNDLTQYVLAVDRGNEKIARLYNPLNPAVVRCISSIVHKGHQAGIWVGICGEIAADPIVAYLLLGLGIDEFSVSPIFAPNIKRLVRSVKMLDAQLAAQHVLTMSSAGQIRDYLKEQIKHTMV